MNKTDTTFLFEKFNKQTILVIGDVMLDAYLWGKVTRISPEAPVPIVSVVNQDERLGGAANVALNVQSLGATPILCSVIGNDEKGKIFSSLLKQQNLSDEGILVSTLRPTTVKTRIISGNQQMLRVDREVEEILVEEETEKLYVTISQIISARSIDAVIFEDYDKGVISSILIEKVISLCREQNIPVCVDPKRKNFFDYKDVTLFKPNLKELSEGLNVILKNDLKEIESAGRKLLSIINASWIMVTLSKLGVLILDKNQTIHIPAFQRDIADVSGAGDTVISVASLCLAQGLDMRTVATIANLAGGLVCEKVGVVPIKKDLLQSEIEKNQLVTIIQ